MMSRKREVGVCERKGDKFREREKEEKDVNGEKEKMD